ncbi:MAG: hypothetical protein KF729_31455 [Sandaracinaceae bacterium]|nr:hypothetical protein [Sandaracinaceae bacterium]
MSVTPTRWAALLGAVALACAEPASPPTPTAPLEAPRTPGPEPVVAEPAPADTRPDWLEAIEDEAAWALLRAPSNEHALARTEVVKLLWDHRTDRLWFCQSERWPLHYDFAVRFLATGERPLGDRRTFNRRQYLGAEREMQLASLVRYRDADRFTLELGPADDLDGEGVLRLFERVRAAVFFGDVLHYRPRSELHARRIRRVRAAVRALDPNELWAGARYQPITLGQSVGRLRFVRGALDPSSVVPDQILVLDHVPDDVPLCAGIVTAELQAPLAHVAVLSQSRGTPNMALRGVFDGPLRALDERIVRLRVAADDFALEPADAEALRASLEASRPAPVEPPALDATREALADTCTLRLADAAWAGSKAAQLGEVCAAGVPTSAGFVVPLHHALAHLTRHRIDASAATLRASPGFAEDGAARAAALSGLRAQIENAELDPALLDAIGARVRRVRGRRWIFRSSTNAEDLPGFSGAGLYESVVTPADPSPAQIARALREVWASVWTRRAWDEREHYRLDHDRVAMAVLVQPFLDQVVAMGVAITENPFSSVRSGILVDLAPRGASVTAAAGEELPEQILLYRHSQPEVISRSTQSGGRPLLTEGAMRPLRERLDRVHAHMMALWGERADAADVELALLADGSAVILQARPYRMRR